MADVSASLRGMRRLSCIRSEVRHRQQGLTSELAERIRAARSAGSRWESSSSHPTASHDL